MAIPNIHLLPILIFVWFPLTFVTTYIIAVVRKDVNPIFPYISDTGTFSPESCIFGQMLNMGAIYMALFAYIRYKAVKDICERNHLSKKIHKRNSTAVCYGLISAFGIMVVGNFQETNIFAVHLLGAFLTFGLGVVWQCYQTWLSFKLFPIVGQSSTNKARLVLTIICGITQNVGFVFAVLSIINFRGFDITKWNEKDGGYNYHIISTVCEWIAALSSLSYNITFTSEFKQITVKNIEVNVNETSTVNISIMSNAMKDIKQNDRTIVVKSSDP